MAALEICAQSQGSLWRDLLGDDLRLSWDLAVYRRPQASRAFPWHQDNRYEFDDPQTRPTYWIPLTPATIEKGCSWVWPGVRRLGTLSHWPTDIGYVCKGHDSGAQYASGGGHRSDGSMCYDPGWQFPVVAVVSRCPQPTERRWDAAG